MGPSRSTLSLGNAECPNYKFLAENIKVLDAKIKVLEATLEMKMHSENHTLESTSILHELRNEIEKLGFGFQWRRLIKASLTSARTSILVNGSPTYEFSLKRGLRQGDPLSPFLFIIVIEGLYIALKDGLAANMFSGVKILNVFYIYSGLKINVNESNLYGMGVSFSKIERLALGTGCMAGGLGVGSLMAFNISMLLKWRWRLLSSSGSLWVKVVKSIHGDEAGIDLRDLPIYIRYNSLYRLEMYTNVHIRDCIVNGCWSWDWYRPVTTGRSYADFINLLEEIGSLEMVNGGDCGSCTLSQDGSYSGDDYVARANTLKDAVKTMIQKAGNLLRTLELVDELQRLGISYHFEDDINVVGMLNLYEASYHSFEDESILNDARDITTKYLKQSLEKIDDGSIFLLVSHALEQPLHWRVPRVESKWFIELYEKRGGASPTIVELAKLDFDMVQALHLEDLKHTSRTITKVASMITTLDDVYDVFGTLGELEQFTDVINRRHLVTLTCSRSFKGEMARGDTLKSIQLYMLRAHKCSEGWDASSELLFRGRRDSIGHAPYPYPKITRSPVMPSRAEPEIFLGDDMYPTFFYDDDRDMDLFNLISAPNPTKVKTGTCPRAAHKVPLLTVTASRVIEMEDAVVALESSRTPSIIEKSQPDFANEDPPQKITERGRTEDRVRDEVAYEIPLTGNASTTGVTLETGLEEEVASMRPQVNKRRRKRGNDGTDANAPLKVLRKDHVAIRPAQSTLGGKSLAAMGLDAGSTLITPATQETPSDAKSVSDPDPLYHTNKSNDSQCKSSRKTAPEILTENVATAEAQDMFSVESPRSGKSTSVPSMVGSPGGIYQPGWGVTNNCRLDTPDACQDVVDHIVPSGYFSELRHLPNADFLSQYNMNQARQVSIGSQLRLRFEQEVRLLKKAKAQIARRDQRIQVREEEKLGPCTRNKTPLILSWERIPPLDSGVRTSAGIEGLVECKALANNLRHIQVKDIVKEVEDHLNTYSSAGMDISEEQAELKHFFKLGFGGKLNKALSQDKRSFDL
ncbi:gypsy type transposase [Tanacetum coccineum]